MPSRLIAIAFIGCSLLLGVIHAQRKPNRKPPAQPCQQAKNQMELNACFCEEYLKADAELNRVYQQLLAATEDAGYKEKLKAAQRSWIAFRDAHLETVYPTVENPRATYGSVYTMCYCSAQQELTVARTKQLKEMLNPTEGDVCG